MIHPANSEAVVGFSNFLDKMVSFSTAEKELVLSKFGFAKFSTNYQLVPFGSKTEDLHFIVKGCIRKYCVRDGEEVTILLATEGQFAVEYTSFQTGKTSTNVLECLESCELLTIRKPDLEQLYLQLPKMNRLIRKVLEWVLLDTQLMLNNFIMLNPEQRYLNLLNTRPEILNRVSQHIIASYLGISPTSLSRIRKRISTKNRALLYCLL